MAEYRYAETERRIYICKICMGAPLYLEVRNAVKSSAGETWRESLFVVWLTND